MHHIAGEQRVCFARISSSFVAFGCKCAQAGGQPTGNNFATCDHDATCDYVQARCHVASEYFAAQHNLAKRKSTHDDASKHVWAQRQPAGVGLRQFLAIGEQTIRKFAVRKSSLGEFAVGDSFCVKCSVGEQTFGEFSVNQSFCVQCSICEQAVSEQADDRRYVGLRKSQRWQRPRGRTARVDRQRQRNGQRCRQVLNG